MATKEELFAAVRLIKEHCRSHVGYCNICPIFALCSGGEYNGNMHHIGNTYPYFWPNPERGGGEDG